MKTARVFLVDPHPATIEGLKSLLGVDPARWQICAHATDGREAVARAIELAPDLVVLDDQLPRLGGLEAALEIMRQVSSAEVLLFISARLPGALARLYHSKVRGCLLKTEPLDDLLLALETIRRHHRFRSHGIIEICEKFEESSARTKLLSPREIEIVCLIGKGFTTKLIASELGVSIPTIETHRSHIFRKLALHSMVEVARYAIRHGLVEL